MGAEPSAARSAKITEFFLTASARLRGIRAFARDTSWRARRAWSFLLLLSLFGAYRLHLATRHVQPADTPQAASAATFARHWIALGLLPPLLCQLPAGAAGASAADRPRHSDLVSSPFLFCFPRFIEPRFRTLLYCLAGVYALNAFVGWMSLSPAHKREVQFLDLVGLCSLRVLVRPSRTERSKEKATRSLLRLFGMRLAVVILGISLAANLFGYVKLAQFLGLPALYSTFIAISMFTGVRVFTLLLLAGIDSPGAQQTGRRSLHRDGIARWVPRLCDGREFSSG